MLTQLNRLMVPMVLCGLLALMARPGQAQVEDDPEAWWPADYSPYFIDYVPSEAYREMEICEGNEIESGCFISGQLMISISVAAVP